MYIYQTDEVKFSVSYFKNDKLTRLLFDSYRDAMIVANKIPTQLIFVDVKVSNKDKTSGFTAPLYKINGRKEKTLIHGPWLKELTSLGFIDYII